MAQHRNDFGNSPSPMDSTENDLRKNIQMLLKQMESLHTKVDRVNEKVDTLQGQFTKFVDSGKHHQAGSREYIGPVDMGCSDESTDSGYLQVSMPNGLHFDDATYDFPQSSAESVISGGRGPRANPIGAVMDEKDEAKKKDRRTLKQTDSPVGSRYDSGTWNRTDKVESDDTHGDRPGTKPAVIAVRNGDAKEIPLDRVTVYNAEEVHSQPCVAETGPQSKSKTSNASKTSDRLEGFEDNSGKLDDGGADDADASDPYAGKQSFAANFGTEIPQPRAPSPVPMAKTKIRTPYSYFKRKRTDVFDDNRPKYFDKMLKIESFAGAEDMDQTAVKEPFPNTGGHSPTSDFTKNGEPSVPRNNQQIPVSGFKNEHGPSDNRFINEAHTQPSPHRQDIVLSNVTFILPGQPLEPVLSQRSPAAGEGAVPLMKKKITDKDINALLQKQKQKAQECTDPKSNHGIDTVICLDTSTSMRGQPLEKAMRFITSFLQGLEESATEYSLEENVALVTFGHEHQVLQHLTNKYDLIYSALEGVEGDGPSPLWLGIAFCLTELSVRGGKCKMDSQEILPRIIVISDFLSSPKTLVNGPDIIQVDEKANTEVSGIIKKNKTCVSSFDFVVCGSSHNQALLDQIGDDRVFTTEGVLYLTQFFRAQHVLDNILAQSREDVIDEVYINRKIREWGLTERAEMDIKKAVEEELEIQFTSEEALSSVASLPSGPQLVSVEEVEEPVFGSKVKANPECVEYHTRQHMRGTVIGPRKKGFLKILWEDKTQEKLKYGVEGEFDIVLDESEDNITDEDTPIAGTVVGRGPDWRWGDQDGGEGNIGVVTDYDANKKIVTVLWGKGGQGNYRFGYNKRYDVVRRLPREKPGKEPEKQAYWQMQLANGTWMFFDPEVNDSIEKKFLSKERKTLLVDIENSSYRVSINSLTARNTSSNYNHAIQRQELTREDWLSVINES